VLVQISLRLHHKAGAGGLPQSAQGPSQAALAGDPGWGQTHHSHFVRDYLDSLDGYIQIAFLPAYAPELNPLEYVWAWLKRHTMANYCPDNLGELQTTARNKLKSAQKRPSIVAACWAQANLW
jgi:hypothetical protein